MRPPMPGKSAVANGGDFSGSNVQLLMKVTLR